MPPAAPRSEPVALLDLAKLVFLVAGAIGIEVSDDQVVQVAIAANAIVAFIAATLATRNRVTPVARAEAAIREVAGKAREAGIAQGISTAGRADPGYYTAAPIVPPPPPPRQRRPMPDYLGTLPRQPAGLDVTDTDGARWPAPRRPGG